MQINIKLEGIDKALKSYKPRIVHRAVKSSLNKVAKKGATTASSEIRKTYAIKKKDINRKAMSIVKARMGGASMTSEIRVIGRPLSLAMFKARQTRRGVNVTIKKGQGRTKLDHHFIARMRSGHLGVFKRLGKARLPIAEPRMISVPSMFGGDNVLPKVKDRILKEWPRVFEHELKFYLSKAR